MVDRAGTGSLHPVRGESRSYAACWSPPGSGKPVAWTVPCSFKPVQKNRAQSERGRQARFEIGPRSDRNVGDLPAKMTSD